MVTTLFESQRKIENTLQLEMKFDDSFVSYRIRILVCQLSIEHNTSNHIVAIVHFFFFTCCIFAFTGVFVACPWLLTKLLSVQGKKTTGSLRIVYYIQWVLGVKTCHIINLCPNGSLIFLSLLIHFRLRYRTKNGGHKKILCICSESSSIQGARGRTAFLVCRTGCIILLSLLIVMTS